MSALKILYFKYGNFCYTLNTLSVAERAKKIIKNTKHEIYEKSFVEGVSVRGNCGGEEIKYFLYDICV